MSVTNLITACENAWKHIQEFHPELPEAIIIVGSGGRSAANLLGHFSPDIWEREGEEVHEVLLVAEQLRRGPEEVFNTLLHEAVHGLANARKIKDVSGKRHNKRFGLLAEEMGLIPPWDNPHRTLGYSDAQLSELARERYAVDIEAIGDALQVFRKLKLKERGTKKTTWIAECQCERKLRFPKKSIDDPRDLAVVCRMCGTDFALREEDLDEFEELHGVWS